MEKLKLYLDNTKSIPFSILATLPLLLGYYILLFLGQSSVKNAAETWLFSLIGANINAYALTLGAIYFSALLYVLFKKEYTLDSFRDNFPYLILESLFWAILSWTVVSFGIKAILLSVQELNELSYLSQLGMSLGAGLFEELLFRVLIQGSLLIILERFLSFDKWLSAIIAVAVSAFLFSMAHYVGSMGDTFELASFVYRFLYGLIFSILIYYRGFAVTSWTHALYDVLVITF